MLQILVVAAATIIIILSVIAGRLVWKLKKQTDKTHEFNEAINQRAAEKIIQIQNDVQFIAKAYLASQVELSEASLRIHNLVNLLGFEGDLRAKVSVFDDVANEIGHIPTHQNWKNLSKEEKKAFRAVFEQLEEKYGERAKQLAQGLAAGELINPS